MTNRRGPVSVEPVRSCTVVEAMFLVPSASHTAAELVALRDEIAPPALLLLTQS